MAFERRRASRTAAGDSICDRPDRDETDRAEAKDLAEEADEAR